MLLGAIVEDLSSFFSIILYSLSTQRHRMNRLSLLLLVCGFHAWHGVVAYRASAESVVASVEASDPTAQIDVFLQAQWDQQSVAPASRCSDRTFVRRIYLDLAGRIPTADEVRRFLDDGGDSNRDQLIDQLLDSEDCVQHFTDLFDALLMGRASENQYNERRNHHWRFYLETVLRDNRPWNQVVSEILLARPESEHQRGAIWYLYERNNDYQAIAESIAPAFFGIRIECAQCHDHMSADEIKQEHYWGLVAFFNRTKNENTKNGPRLAESAVGGFSEFADIHGNSSPNVLSFLAANVVAEPRPLADTNQEDADTLYRAPLNEGDPRIPNFSRREKFVQQVVDGHPLIARAAVNRIWALLMARGIVHPFDEMDSVHQPSHPELLDWLAEDFVASGYDIRRLVRSIVRSHAYQLESIQPLGVDDPASFAWYLERPLTAEQMARSIQLAVRNGLSSDDGITGMFRQQFPDVLPDQNIVTVGDTLFLSNHAAFDQYLIDSNQSDHLVPRLLAIKQPEKQIDGMFQTAFGRPALDDEHAAIKQFLDDRKDALELGLRQVVWSLLTSAEFRFNH